MLFILRRTSKVHFSDFIQKNKSFMKKINKYNRDLNIHEKTRNITQEEAEKKVSSLGTEKVASMMTDSAKYDQQFSDFISKFNQKHSGKISLLDFSNYATTFGELKKNPMKKSDMDVLQEFQKRKIDQQVNMYRKKKLQDAGKQQSFSPQSVFGTPKSDKNPFKHPSEKTGVTFGTEKQTTGFVDDVQSPVADGELRQGLFHINDNFVMLLLDRSVSTKVTTLNRLNFFRTLVFMGNGNGIVSHGKGRSQTPEGSLQAAIQQCKKNLIAIPLDNKCTLPKRIKKRFQDYEMELRPIPGFNSWGHPTMSTMLALAGFDHMAFKTHHNSKNNYDLVHCFFKTVTKNTTPKEMAEREGFKVYRHQFIRPLTEQRTHNRLSY